MSILRKLLKERSGLDLSADKQYLVESRLLPLARKAEPAGHCRTGRRRCKGGADALTTEVVEAMTTNETFFFRDKIPFEHLRDVDHAGADRRRAPPAERIRIWCAAASTGQEPYSLAMCLKEMGAQLAGWRIEIVAHRPVAGSAGKVEGRHLQPVRGAARIADPAAGQVLHPDRRDCGRSIAEIRAMVQFRQLNLLQDFSHLGTFDIIFCRNVLIYFDQDTKVSIFEPPRQDAWSPMASWRWAPPRSVVGITDAFKPYPERRGLYRPNVAPVCRGASTRCRKPCGRRRGALSLIFAGRSSAVTGSRAAGSATCCR